MNKLEYKHKIKNILYYLVWGFLFICSYIGISGLFLMLVGGKSQIINKVSVLVLELSLANNPVLAILFIFGIIIIFYGLPIIIADNLIGYFFIKRK